MESGTRIRITTEDENEHIGVVMPSSNKTHLVIKLEDGYNIGIKKEKIKDKEIIGEITRGEFEGEKPERDPELPNISILGTGGTIASKLDYETGGVHPAFSTEELALSFPEMFEIANIEPELILNIFSEDMEPKYWKKMALNIKDKLNSGKDGVVIGHGTDTMGYTGAALSFMLKNLSGPVVLTGSQRSSDRPSSDSALNLICSTKLATTDLGEVAVVMHESMDDEYCAAHKGTKVRKMHTSRRDAFKSINENLIARINENKVEFLQDYNRVNNEETIAKTEMEEKVALVKLYPGVTKEVIHHYIDKDYKGLILEGTGLGHTPNKLIESLERAIEEEIQIYMTSQCLNGRTNLNVYSTGRKLKEAGVIPLEDMLSETAYVKLMWVLGQTKNKKEAEKLMNENLAGEITPYTKPNTYNTHNKLGK